MDKTPYLNLVKSIEPANKYIGLEESLDFQAQLLGAWERQQRILGYAEASITLNIRSVQEFLKISGVFIWKITKVDLDLFYETLIGKRLSHSSRRKYQSAIAIFLDYLRSRHGTEIWQRYQIAVPNVLDKFNRYVHRKDDGNEVVTPPRPEVLDKFWAYMKQEMSTARKPATIARDYALYRVLELAGLRVNEAVQLDMKDCRFDLGTKGKIHVRFGKGSMGAGPKKRWVPIMDELEQLLQWYIEHIRVLFPHSKDGPLFLAEDGKRIKRDTVRGTLRRRQRAWGFSEDEIFSPHQFRHAYASRLTQKGVDLYTLKELLGHVSPTTTLNYVKASTDYLEMRVRLSQDHWRNSLQE
ncbi:MAG TPA: site-specific integrase [Rickettsiales bacterium]|nr:site-specific integrase [Rickettsiales bacterium]